MRNGIEWRFLLFCSESFACGYSVKEFSIRVSVHSLDWKIRVVLFDCVCSFGLLESVVLFLTIFKCNNNFIYAERIFWFYLWTIKKNVFWAKCGCIITNSFFFTNRNSKRNVFWECKILFLCDAILNVNVCSWRKKYMYILEISSTSLVAHLRRLISLYH